MLYDVSAKPGMSIFRVKWVDYFSKIGDASGNIKLICWQFTPPLTGPWTRWLDKLSESASEQRDGMY